MILIKRYCAQPPDAARFVHNNRGSGMGVKAFWEAHVVPRVIKCACASPGIMELRAGVVPRAQGKVFEIGCGGGLNQQFYDPARVTSFAGLDPSGKLLEYARGAAATARFCLYASNS